MEPQRIDRIHVYNANEDDNTQIPYVSICFPAGEPHVIVDRKLIDGQPIWVDARLCSAFGFMRLLTLLDAIKYCNPSKLGLFLPYFPAGRQDRHQEGTAFTLEIYADCLRRAKIDYMLGFDPHSQNVNRYYSEIITPSDVFGESLINPKNYVGVICPDAGAVMRSKYFAERLGCNNIVFCEKKRDPNTGKLSDFNVPQPSIVGRYLLFDDICDGGGTFIAESELFRKTDTGKQCTIDLCISHAIFSKGVNELLNSFDRIITTDSFPFNINPNDRIQWVPLFWFAAGRMRQNLL